MWRTLKKSLINKVKNWLSGVLSFAGDVWNILLVYSFEESGIMTCLQEGSMNYWMECMTQMSPSRDRYIGVGLYMADQVFCEGLKNPVTWDKGWIDLICLNFWQFDIAKACYLSSELRFSNVTSFSVLCTWV